MPVEHALEVHPGLGAIPSPPDERDFTFDQLVLAVGKELTAALPAAFIVPNLPVQLNQGNTPMCVAYSHSALKDWQDYPDTAPARHWNFDEPTFFRLIGGTSNGAIIRNALARLLHNGYPVVSNASPVATHRIKAYYGIAKSKATLEQAVHDFGPLVLGTTWYHSWFHPTGAAGHRVLPAPDYAVGGHAILVVGYNATGLILRNSWGASWGDHGNVVMPWAYVLGSPVHEVWKALDA